MQKIKISDETALKIYPTAAPELKSILEESFPPGFFSQKITDRVKNFNDILRIKGMTMESFVRPGETADELAHRQIKLIAEVYNEGVVLDPMNTNQYKYYPWHVIDNSSGFGLSYDVYDCWFTDSVVGVRHCFVSRELAIDAGKKFIEIYANLKIK